MNAPRAYGVVDPTLCQYSERIEGDLKRWGRVVRVRDRSGEALFLMRSAAGGFGGISGSFDAPVALRFIVPGSATDAPDPASRIIRHDN